MENTNTNYPQAPLGEEAIRGGKEIAYIVTKIVRLGNRKLDVKIILQKDKCPLILYKDPESVFYCVLGSENAKKVKKTDPDKYDILRVLSDMTLWCLIADTRDDIEVSALLQRIYDVNNYGSDYVCGLCGLRTQCEAQDGMTNDKKRR